MIVSMKYEEKPPGGATRVGKPRFLS